MNYWLISDTHFGHVRMLENDVGRKPGYEEKILRQIDVNVNKPDNIFIHLGDVCIGDERKWHNAVYTATKKCAGAILVRGNHDKRSAHWYLRHCWSFVCDRFDLNVYGLHIAFTHIKLDDVSGINLNIHGHSHKNNHHDENYTDKHLMLQCDDNCNAWSLKNLVNNYHKRGLKMV